MTKRLILFLGLCSMSICNTCHAAEQNSLDTLTGNVRYLFDKMDYLTYFAKPIKKDLYEKKVDINFSGSFLQGLDNNVFLDPRRKKDAFMDTGVSLDAGYQYTDDIRLKIGADATNITYYRFNDNSLLDLYGTSGFDVDFFDDKLVVQPGYNFEYLIFPSDETGSYYSNEFALYFRNNVTGRFYQRFGGKLEYRNYTDRKTYGSNRVKKSELETHMKYTGEYELSFKPSKHFRIRGSIHFFRNDSNNQYYDFYDYIGMREKTSLTVYLTKKLYNITSLSYIRKNYDDRLSTKDDTHQKDNLFLFDTSVMYDITSSFTLTVSLSYRENVTNEPLDKYSGSIVNMGVYYFF